MIRNDQRLEDERTACRLESGWHWTTDVGNDTAHALTLHVHISISTIFVCNKCCATILWVPHIQQIPGNRVLRERIFVASIQRLHHSRPNTQANPSAIFLISLTNRWCDGRHDHVWGAVLLGCDARWCDEY
jgi:hypothetical protein